MRLVVYSRDGCGLCAELIEELAPLLAGQGLEFTVADVDRDATLKRRYGLRVPVLTLDGEWLCNGRLDRAALERGLLAAKAAAASGDGAARLL